MAKCNCPADTSAELDYVDGAYVHCGYCKGEVRLVIPRARIARPRAARKMVKR